MISDFFLQNVVKYLQVRCMVQSANGRFKRWRYLDRTVPNTQTPYVGDYVWIISAICNRYTPPLSLAKTEEDTAIAVKMLYSSCQLNELLNLIETERIHRRSFTWTKLPVWLQSSLNCQKQKFVRSHLEHMSRMFGIQIL